MLRIATIGLTLVGLQAQTIKVSDEAVKPSFMPICPPPQTPHWTPWFDRDNSNGVGDYETLIDLIKEGKDICPKPLSIDCMTTTGLSAIATGEIVHMDPNVGCYCKNTEQPDGVCNYDYKVRFLCCRECPYGQNSYWTSWFDRDNPSGNGDYENLSLLLAEGKPICKVPIDVQCVTLNGLSIAATGEIVHYSPTTGCYCVNAEQPDGKCNYDYKVRFKCCK